MSYDASIYSHVYNPPITEITAEVRCGIAREQRWWPGTIVNSAPSQLEIETNGDGSALARMPHTERPAGLARRVKVCPSRLNGAWITWPKKPTNETSTFLERRES